MNKNDKLLEWCRIKKLFSSVDIQEYKNYAYHLGADRCVRKLAENGIIRRLPNEEIDIRGLRKEGNARIGFWEIL